MHSNGNHDEEEIPYELRFDVTAHFLASNEAMWHALLFLETDDGKNKWYEEKSRYNLLASYQEDIKSGWRIAERKVQEKLRAKSEVGAPLGIFCRYPLIKASLAGWGSGMDPDLVIELVDTGLKPLEWGITATDFIDDASDRLRTLSILASHYEEPDRTRTFERILADFGEVDDEMNLVWLLEEIAPHIPKALLPKLVESLERWPFRTSDIPEDWLGYSPALAAILPFLLEPDRTNVLHKCLKSARATPGSREHATTLSMVLPFLPKREQEEVRVECIDCIGQAVLKNKIAYGVWMKYGGKLMPCLAQYVSPGFFETLLSLETNEYSRNSLGDMLYNNICLDLAQNKRISKIKRLILISTYFSSIKDEEKRLLTLLYMLPFVPAKSLPFILTPPEVFEHITIWQVPKLILVGILKRISKRADNELAQLYSYLLTKIMAIEDSSDRIPALIRLLPYLSPSSQETVKQDILEMMIGETRAKRVEYLVRLSKQAPLTQRKELLEKALSLMRFEDTAAFHALDIVCSTSLDNGAFRRDHLEELLYLYPEEGQCCLLVLIDLLSPELLEAAWEIIQSVEPGDPYLLAKWISRAMILGEFEQARNCIREFLPELGIDSLVPFLGSLPPSAINEDILACIVERIVSIQEEGAVLRNMNVLDLDCVTDHLPEQSINRLVLWSQSFSTRYSSLVMSQLIPCYARLGHLEYAYQQVHALDAYADKARALVKIAQYVDDPIRSSYLEEVKEYLKKAQDPENFSSETKTAIEAFAMPGEDPYSFVDTRPSAKTLVLMAQLLPAEESVAYWSAIPLALVDYFYRYEILIALLPELPLFAIQKILQILAQGSDQHKMKYIALLASLLKCIEDIDPQECFGILKDYLYRCVDRGRKKLLLDLGVLVPTLLTLGGKETIVQLQHAAQCVCRWWP